MALQRLVDQLRERSRLWHRQARAAALRTLLEGYRWRIVLTMEGETAYQHLGRGYARTDMNDLNKWVFAMYSPLSEKALTADSEQIRDAVNWMSTGEGYTDADHANFKTLFRMPYNRCPTTPIPPLLPDEDLQQ